MIDVLNAISTVIRECGWGMHNKESWKSSIWTIGEDECHIYIMRPKSPIFGLHRPKRKLNTLSISSDGILRISYMNEYWFEEHMGDPDCLDRLRLSLL